MAEENGDQLDADQELYEEARSYVQKLKGFYSHLAAYVGVMVLLHLINLFASGSYWAFWPALGWGIGLLAHGNSVMRWVDYFGTDWEERKIREYLGGDRGNSR